MFRYLIILFVLITTAFSATAQLPFKNDNKIYKAVYLNEAFRYMDTSSNFVLLDVRSPGEYADTSRHTSLNIGRIKGAVNINIDDIPAHLPELKKYANQPVFVYCSHSQRSRRVSKFLSENGFTNVYNINGGMSVVNEADAGRFPYKNKVLQTNTSYINIASADAINLLKNTPGLVIIDIRGAKGFSDKDSSAMNNIGHLKNALNFPQDEFEKKLAASNIPATKPVLLYDLNGYNSMDVVDFLRAKGFTRIYNLYEGYAALLPDHGWDKKSREKFFVNAPDFNIVDPETTISLLKQNPNLLILDTRSPEEFNNKASMNHLNLGRLNGAINVTSMELLEKAINGKEKSTKILVYGSGDNFSYVAAQSLYKKGFHQVNYLKASFYGYVWSTFNIEACKEGKVFLANHEELY